MQLTVRLRAKKKYTRSTTVSLESSVFSKISGLTIHGCISHLRRLQALFITDLLLDKLECESEFSRQTPLHWLRYKCNSLYRSL